MEEITIGRSEYIKKLIAFKDKSVIKVITGVRRCGKSTLMELFIKYLQENGIDENQIISINLEDLDYYELQDPFKLHTYIKEKLVKNKKNYIFIDEIQNCIDFPKVIDSLFIKKNVDLYLTGSNAYMLSSEIATLLSGRYVEISMLPFSFAEFVSATENKENLPQKYKEYIATSSFPYAMELKNQPKELKDYLEGIYNSIVMKDIAQRKKISDMMQFKSLTNFVFDSIGSQLSTKKIADTMTSNGRKIDTKTVEKYLDGLKESFIIYQAKRYNIKGKEHLKTLEKYFVVDVGMRFMLLGRRSTDVGHILENIIYLELLRRDFEVFVGKIDDLEVDFVAFKQNEPVYIQVSASVRDEKTLERELASLKKINDHFPKLLLTLDEDPEANYDGIKRMNALDWLVDTEV